MFVAMGGIFPQSATNEGQPYLVSPTQVLGMHGPAVAESLLMAVHCKELRRLWKVGLDQKSQMDQRKARGH